MSMFRSIVGAAVGATVATVALRVRSVSKERGAPIGEVVADLPGILAEDVTRIADSARHAVEDGRRAAVRAREDFDEQVAASSRRTKGEDV